MKLSEILKEQEVSAIRQWWMNWRWTPRTDRSDVEEEIKNVLTADDKIKPGKSYITVNPMIKGDNVYDPPMDKNWWSKDVKDFSIAKGADRFVIVPNFECIPSAIEHLSLSATIVKTLKGIEDLHYLTSFSVSHNTEFNCGLLRLLKCPVLTYVGNSGKDVDKKLQDALDIIKKHLKDKNIPECQQELIEEGLQEYAKL